jgi:hypothetical protein
MTTTLLLKVTEDGLRLPRRLFRQTGEVEVVERNDYILIKPKSSEPQDARARAIAALREAQLLVTPEWEQLPEVSPAERAELAQKARQGKPLSESIIDAREDRA